MDFSDVPPEAADRETVQECIMQWRDLREKRLAAERVANKLKEKETELKSYILEAFKQQKLEGMMIGSRITGLATQTVPSVEDKSAFMKHILSTGHLDLLQFRLATGAVKERWENEQEVPGVGTVEVYDLFDRKV